MQAEFKESTINLKDYVFNAPEGEWKGRLDHKAWGKSKNLFLYFTDLGTHKKYRLSVFARNNYSPYQSKLNFKAEPLNSIYKIKTEKSKKGFPKFLKAIQI